MTQEKINEIKTRASELITEGVDIQELSNNIMLSYIFNAPHEFGTHEHYPIQDIKAIVQEAYNEQYPPVVEEIINEDEE